MARNRPPSSASTSASWLLRVARTRVGGVTVASFVLLASAMVATAWYHSTLKRAYFEACESTLWHIAVLRASQRCVSMRVRIEQIEGRLLSALFERGLAMACRALERAVFGSSSGADLSMCSC